MRRKFRFIGFILAYMSTVHCTAQIPCTMDSLQRILGKGLNFLAQNQQSTTYKGHHYAGEWPSNISMRTTYMLLAKSADTYDSNCFSLAGIFNLLSSLYLRDTSLNQIPAILDNALPQLLSYYNGASFNFWPLLPPSGRLYMFKENIPGKLVRRPVKFRLRSTYIRKAANIMNDNDDTAQGYLALWNYNQVQLARKEAPSLVQLPLMHRIFDPYRDTGRLSAHYYNVFAFDAFSSGAFLTWRGREDVFPTWNIPKLFINNALFLTEISSVYPYAYKSYMPYSANDVDAVVNANVLSVLASYGELDSTSGSRAAAKFIESKVRRKKWSRAGLYYPNRYHLHYTTIKAWKKGIPMLNASVEQLIQHLKSTQHEDGSFHSRRIVNHKDILQSTAYAFHAMISYGKPDDVLLNSRIERALTYLLKQMHITNNTVCWDGGVFFSGGTVIRNTLYWKSDAYTTALILDGIGQFLKRSKESKLYQ